MFPSLAALGGTLGLLGLREPELVGDGDVDWNNRGYQRHIDSCAVDYAALMRDPASGRADSPIATQVGGLPVLTVALVGGGIANIIAAYELSRIGISCTLFEAQPTLGGRLVSFLPQDTSTAWAEAGAVRYPRGGLTWHYVAQWARAAGLDPETVPINVDSFPSPFTVPTMLSYQGEPYYGSDSGDALPPIVLQARGLFASFLTGLSDGKPDPDTVYFADAVLALKTAPDDATTNLLKGFWESMLKQYDGRSFSAVLQNEVFANRPRLPDLMAAFGTVGVGTGGFSHLYDAAFLEVLRILLWDISEEDMLPEEHDYPDLFIDGTGGANGFAIALAHAAHMEAQAFYPWLTFNEMFQVNSRVTQIIVDEDHGGVAITLDTGHTEQHDFAIVGMTTVDMQQLKLDLPYDLNPLLPPPFVSDLVRPSCDAAVRRLDVMSGYRMTAELPSPRNEDSWPQDTKGDKILCFVTDERPRLAYVLPEVPSVPGLVRVMVADAYGSDAEKFRPLAPLVRKHGVEDSFAYGLQPDGTGGDGVAKPLADLLWLTDAIDVVWGVWPPVQGAFKVDRPADNYFSSSLFYHYQLARESNARMGNTTNVFLSGDSVGHLGGWVEGAAMSAINAVVGVCSRIEVLSPSSIALVDRFRPLLEDEVRLFHRWEDIGGQASSKAGLNSIVRLGNRKGDAAIPPSYRYQRLTWSAPADMVTVSNPGDFLVEAVGRQLMFDYRTAGSSWSGRREIPTPGIFGVRSISVATEKGRPQAQLMYVGDGGEVWHGTFDNGAWSQFQLPWGHTEAEKAALAVEGGNAQVLRCPQDGLLKHSIRFTDGSWASAQ